MSRSFREGIEAQPENLRAGAALLTHALAELDLAPLRAGTIVVDETYIGPDPRNFHSAKRAEYRQRGRGTRGVLPRRDAERRLRFPDQ